MNTTGAANRKIGKHQAVIGGVVLVGWLLAFTGNALTAEPLASWNEGPAKARIVSFVEAVTDEDSPDYIPAEQRIVVFDNDGTLWAEQPAYFQAFFAIDRIKALAPQHPEWKQQEPFASALDNDLEGVLASGERGIVEILAVSHAGMTTEQFEQSVKNWLATAIHPNTGKPFYQMVYQPMLELLDYLRDKDFKTYIVSGGGVEFMRAFAEQSYGIPPEQVIGSSGKQKFEVRNGEPVLIKLPAVDFIDDKDGKPIAIQRIIGRRPIAAFGNSDGDLQMLQWTCSGEGIHLCLYLHHTDAAREWSYDRQSRVGRLDKGLDEARTNGWLVVDMERDWMRVFAFEQ